MKTAWIDFGTTNSTIWYTNWSDVSMVKLQKNWSTSDITSVFYSFEDNGIPIIGEQWKMEYIDWLKWRMITSPKRFLKNEELIEIQILMEKHSLTDIISHIIKHFKVKLENQSGDNIDSILVWRPVRFHDTDDILDKIAENRLKEAFLKAWFKNVEFQYEPIAAFTTYLNQHTELSKWERNILVVDLGWWTSDFSVININNEVSSVLSNTGVYIWWDNIDEKMILWHYWEHLWKWAKQRIMNWSAIEIPNQIFNKFADKSKLIFFNEQEKLVNSLLPLLISNDDKVSLSRLKDIFKDLSIWYDFHSCIEYIKKDLSKSEENNSNFEMFKNQFSSTITRGSFNQIIQKELKLIHDSINEALILSNLHSGQIDKVIMNWGTSLVPIVQNLVNEIVWKGKILSWNTFSAVWHWLTLESFERFK